jgi:hypothetical protein
MAKELPYFQFEPAEYLTKDISFCSLAVQGLFINACAYYWQRECKLTKDQFLRRLNYPQEFDELINEGIIDLQENQVKIKFLDDQFLKATSQSKTNSTNGSKGGRPKSEKRNESETKANLKPNESETKAIREEKIKEDKIKEDNLYTNDFLQRALNSNSWLENVCRATKRDLPTVKSKLNEYDALLLATLDKKNNFKDYGSHFTHWLNKQEVKPTEAPKRANYHFQG